MPSLRHRPVVTLRPSESSENDGPDEEALAHVRRALIGVLRRRDLAATVRALHHRRPLPVTWPGEGIWPPPPFTSPNMVSARDEPSQLKESGL